MWGYIIIRKISESKDVHYYAVYKDNGEKDINYYLGLDALQKKIYFFTDISFVNAFAIYDLKIDRFEKLDSNLKSLISDKIIMKSLGALNNNKFPRSISWEG